ncbi:MAG: hypothetical protein HN578_05460, partial [Rhodospirillales bacterium]|nr:hypothetical protein [Rhodospirillales bacterium]
VLARLASVGIEAQPDEVLRKIADRYGVTPIQVLQTILVKGFKPTRD